MTTRRLVLTRSAAVIGAASTGLLLPELARAQSDKVRVGFMLPYTGTFAQLGVAIENGFRMALNEQGGKLGGREVEFFKVDDESNPAKGIENATRLVQRDKVDVLVGTVHSGVQMGIHKVARDTGVLSLIPNAGVHVATRAQCAPNVFRTSFTNSQPTLALGKAMMERGHKKAVWITWNYAAGDEAFEGFEKSYTEAGGTIIKKLGLPFPNVEFQALLTEIASLNPDAVACFFAGGGAAKFLRDFAAAGLNKNIQLYGSGFLTEGVLDAAGPAADGVLTTMHYSDSLDTPRNKKFRLEYAKAFRMQPDVYAVQGYDTGLLLIKGANAVKGDMSNKPALYAAMNGAEIDSPRGKWKMSAAHNPIQDM
ncbi:ABC transporter substrate-binding protein, partial [Hydrogenophaga sp.]